MTAKLKASYVFIDVTRGQFEMHELADPNDEIISLPDEPQPKSRKRELKRENADDCKI